MAIHLTRGWSTALGCLQALVALSACDDRIQSPPDGGPAGGSAQSAGATGGFSLSPLPNALENCAVDQPLSPSATQIHVSPYGDDALDGATLGTAVGSLSGANARIPPDLDTDYEVIVHDGSDQPEAGGHAEYRYQQTLWTAASTTQRVVIRAAPGQNPIFDGSAPSGDGVPKSYGFHLYREGVTNVTVQGLTFRNYAQVGIWTYGSCNRVYDNKTYDIGDVAAACVWRDDPPSGYPLEVFNRPECSSDWTSGELPRGCECVGYSGILVMYGQNNLIKHNDVVTALNRRALDAHMHSIYLAADARNNLVEDNYVRTVSGSPMKLSCGAAKLPSNDNVYRRNYLERAGSVSFFRDDPQADGPASLNNILDQNVATFPGYRDDNALATPASSFVFLHEQGSRKYFQGGSSASTDELVAGSTVADVSTIPEADSVLAPQVFLALNYPAIGFTKVVYKDAGVANVDLRTVAFSSDEWQVQALTSGHFIEGEPARVVLALRCVPHRAGCGDIPSRTRIVVGAVRNGYYDFDSGTILYDERGRSAWDVTAMTAGKFEGDIDTLIVAARVGSTQHIFRGNGVTAQSEDSALGVSSGKPIYTSDEWRVTTMTSGDVSEDGVVLVTGFTSTNSGPAQNRIYLGDGTTSAVSRRIFESVSQRVVQLAVGKLGGNTTRLATALDDRTTRTIYISDGTVDNLLWRQLYTTPSWSISSLVAGDVDGDSSNDELVASFDLDEPGARFTRVLWGDGISEAGSGELATGVTNGGTYYRTAPEYP